MRWIVAQEGSRRNYAVPVGFNRIGSLRLLYADIWCRQGRSFLKRGPSATRILAGRYSPEISSEQVVSFSLEGIAWKAAHYLKMGANSREKLGHYWCDFGEWFGSRVEKHVGAIDLDPGEDVFFGYNTNCLEAVEKLRGRGVITVVTQVDPGRVEEDLVLAETERWPNWERVHGRMPERYWDRLKAEWTAADLLGVNSEWSKEALIRQGVPAEKIFVVPVAIDLKKSIQAPRRAWGGSFKVLWLGSVILRKGIQYLVEAAKLLSNTDMEFLIAGEVGINRQVVASFPANMKMLGRLTRDRVNALYSEADVFVLPTVSDGFAVTQLEAMAQGLPVVTTPNCGRVVTDGVDGLIVPARNAQALAEALARLHRDRNLLCEMSRQAQISVRRFDLPFNAQAINDAVTDHRRRNLEVSQNLNAKAPVSKAGSNASINLSIRTGDPAAGAPTTGQFSDRLPKAVVSFAGSRDHYQLAWALQGAGLLERLITDIYLEPEVIPFGTQVGRRFPKLMARRSPGLSRRKVLTPMGAMMDGLLMRTALATKERQIRLDRHLGQTARELAWRAQSALFSYSYYAAAAFEPGPSRPPMRFLFQLHPHPAVVREVLQTELARNPRFAASLKWEHEIGAPEAHFKSLCEESQLANGWVVASSYTAKTLADQGIPRSEIHVIPYGVDTGEYPCRDFAPRAEDPFRVIWVGSMTQRKGLSYFLEAMGSLPQENLEVLICGHHAVDRTLIKEFGIRNVRVFQGLPTKQLTYLLRTCDLFVLPSLVEGFAHVILEAMSSGVPVLTTSSTCAPDVMKDGVHGFIVPIRDPAAIAGRVLWGRQHRMELYWMGQAAAAQAQTFTWERFRRGVVQAYAEMVGACLSRPEIMSEDWKTPAVN